MSALVQLAHEVSDQIASVAQLLPEAPPTPGDQDPPGAGQVNKVLGWLKWLVYAACLAGTLIAAGGMAIAHQRGGKEETVAKLAWVVGACIIAGSSTAIVAEFLVA